MSGYCALRRPSAAAPSVLAKPFNGGMGLLRICDSKSPVSPCTPMGMQERVSECCGCPEMPRKVAAEP
eukprot:11657286-Alexandrium_andersonii.AAC.1